MNFETDRRGALKGAAGVSALGAFGGCASLCKGCGKICLTSLLACVSAMIAMPGSGAEDVAWIDIPAVSRAPSATVHATCALGSVSGASAAPAAPYAGLDTTPLVFSLASECRAFSSYPPGMVLMFR